VVDFACEIAAASREPLACFLSSSPTIHWQLAPQALTLDGLGAGGAPFNVACKSPLPNLLQYSLSQLAPS